MTKFEHKHGSTVNLDFAYALSAGVIPTQVGIQYAGPMYFTPEWIPSFEGMTRGAGVIPTQVGIQYAGVTYCTRDWIPSSEGMTHGKRGAVSPIGTTT